MWSGFARQHQWQSAVAAAPVWRWLRAATPPPLRHQPSDGLRWHSELTQLKTDGPDDILIYRGPFSVAVKRVKTLSLFSCACAIAAGPVIFGLDASTTVTAKLSIVGTLATFGVFTTGLLSWFTHPYIHQLRYDRSSDTLEATTLSLLARTRTDRFQVSEVGEADSMHPLTSFQARGRMYYVDAEHFPDKALLARLVPLQAEQAQQAQQAADNQQQQYGQQQQQQARQPPAVGGAAQGEQQQQQQQGQQQGSGKP